MENLVKCKNFLDLKNSDISKYICHKEQHNHFSTLEDYNLDLCIQLLYLILNFVEISWPV